MHVSPKGTTFHVDDTGHHVYTLSDEINERLKHPSPTYGTLPARVELLITNEFGAWPSIVKPIRWTLYTGPRTRKRIFKFQPERPIH